MEHEHLDHDFIEEPKKWYIVWTQRIMAFAIVLGLIYISGIHQYALLRRTPSDIQQMPIASLVNAEAIDLPLNVIVIRSDQPGGSNRTQDEIDSILENAEKIWKQANIQFDIQNIQEIKLTADQLFSFKNTPNSFITSLSVYNPRYINVFLIGVLGGDVNGLSYGGTTAVSVADYTSNFDFRTLAHEVGHQLHLPHTPLNRQRLMYRGANGFELTVEEAISARTIAQALIENTTTPPQQSHVE